YNLNGFENYPTLFLYPKYQFFNPKFGITYNKNKWRIYGSVAVANKEPNRTDFETGNTNLPLPEQLIDIECGAHFDNKNNFNVNLNLFFMEYQNQLVLTGKINDIGAYTRTNVPTSFRRGIEVESNYKFLKYFNMSGNLTWSLNKILNYTNYIDYADGSGKQFEQYFSTTDIGFSPSLIQNFMLKFQKKQWGIQYSEQYVGKQYLDNTSSNSKSINAYMVHNLRVDYNYESKKKFKLICSLLVNNLFNEVYEPNGYTYSTYSNGDITNYNYFYPMAGTNYNVVLNIVF
ncbi:MAG: TonB-dependent receptor, partial [Sediminibacterium sp.]|nr:TonB-dependent receptor [Sediminibacterium sp.]